MVKLPLVLMAVLSAVSASACTGVYVGKRASASGHALLCRTVDLPPVTLLFRTVSRARGEKGNRYRYVATPAATQNGFGDFASLGINECGFAMTAMVSGYASEAVRKADPFVKGGLCEPDMTGEIAGNCATVREALDAVERIVRTRGCKEGMIVLFADREEAWLVEVYSGHEWAAVRMPEDKVAGFGNEFGIRAFVPRAEGTRSSEGLASFPEKHGILRKNKDGSLDLAATYAAPRCDFAHVRTWLCRRALAGEKAAGAYDRHSRDELFFTPSHKISKTEVFELFRNRGEGTVWCPETTRRTDARIIGDEAQGTSHVIAICDGLPAPISCTAWIALGAAEHSVFLPVNAAATRTADAFSRDSRAGAAKGAYDPLLAAAHFRRLSALAELDRVFYGQGVRDYWRLCEERLVTAEAAAQAEAARLYATDPAAAVRYLTDRAVTIEEAALSDAKELFDRLAWYLTANNSVRRYGNNYHTLVLTPFDPKKPFAVEPDSLMLSKIQAVAVPETK